jgi:hypothetical protein
MKKLTGWEFVNNGEGQAYKGKGVLTVPSI